MFKDMLGKYLPKQNIHLYIAVLIQLLYFKSWNLGKNFIFEFIFFLPSWQIKLNFKLLMLSLVLYIITKYFISIKLVEINDRRILKCHFSEEQHY